MAVEAGNVKVYTVNGATAGASSSLPDWLTRKRAASKGKGKRAIREHFQGTIELIQGFEFPEASNKVKTTRDGTHVIATGTYKPQIRVWDLGQLSLKFERHTDAENVDFALLSDDWTKSIHLQNDRSIELHTQGGFHYRTRIPRFGRSVAYHFPSCDALFSATGNEIYRLNLDQGRFMTPLTLESDHEILGVNCIDINPAHQLFAFGVDGNGTAQFWDPRSRSCVGVLELPANKLASSSFDGSVEAFGVTAIASRPDGLSYAIGTSTGHTLLYDIRAAKHYAMKDQGYGLPMKNVLWIEGGSRMAGDGMVLSADKKVIKIWDRASPSTNFCSITPAADLNDVHHVPGSGLLLAANEVSSRISPKKWKITLLGNVYEDYKFIERSELAKLGLDHLVGTPALKPYMHGYFISLKLYDTARLIANPFAYAEHREKMIREKMDKLSETRIRSKKPAAGVKVNKALAEKILKEEEKAKRREERKRKKAAQNEEEEEEEEEDHMDVDDEEEEQKENAGASLLNDPRFSKVFEDPEFEIDVNSREYALLNPSSVAQRNSMYDRGKTAVEDEEDESDKASSDGIEESDSDSEDGGSSDDSSDAGELTKFDPRKRPGQKNARAEEVYARTKQQNHKANVKLVPMRAQAGADGLNGSKEVTFGQRKAQGTGAAQRSGKAKESVGFGEDGGLEMTFVPSKSSTESTQEASARPKAKRKGVETFGAGMERGGEERQVEVSESDRKGRTHRRQGVRSGSKNMFRRM
ncbi:Small ribosomal subunit biogenesis [Paramarasmius palmivorus]|uniref:Small ribosomal subunit biogenesis n=1 Tax=Paramarasmius palmivorus TaxID=297713 RepID=A0AAW0CCE3_9AGAR